jgi:predicted RNA binding protein YcfA (HicA-like mRNA interferase family)
MKVRDVIKLIEADGWYLVTTKGSHRQYKHPTKKGKVTIAGHPGVDIPVGTLRNILKQAKVQEDES